MRIFLSILGCAFFTFSLQAIPFEIDSAHSSVQFIIRNQGVTKLTGHFNKFDGLLNFDFEKNSASNIEVTIGIKSIATGNPQWDKQLISKDFFDAKVFPDMIFKSTKIKDVKQQDTKGVEGKLTLHGITRNVTFSVTIGEVTINLDGSVEVTFSATTHVDLKNFGLDFTKPLNPGEVIIENEIQIQFDAHGTVNPS